MRKWSFHQSNQTSDPVKFILIKNFENLIQLKANFRYQNYYRKKEGKGLECQRAFNR